MTLLVMSAIVWLLLTGSLATQELVAGALVTVAVTLIAYPKSGILGGVHWSPLLPWYILVYLWVFSLALFKSNFDVARRVLTPVCQSVQVSSRSGPT